MSLAGVEGYYGEQGYDYEEIKLQDFVEWEEGEGDEDAGIPQRQVHIGPLRYILPWGRERGSKTGAGAGLGESGSTV